jgi:YggT family protein
MRALLDVIMLGLELYTWVIMAVAVMSWLIAFNIINIYNDVVRSLWNTMNGLTEPALRPIRNFMPQMGGLDISPVILLLVIYFIQRVIQYYLYPLAMGF